jgi:hypothetical protein
MKIMSFILLSALLVLSGCVGAPTKPMTQVGYQKPIMSSSQRSATLVWRMGKVQGARTDEADVNGDDDPLADAVVQLVKPRSSADVVFAYGKAQQSVFMTSLQKVLQKNNVFSQVDLKPYTAQQSAKNVMIEVYFKRTRVGEKSSRYPMSLDVHLIIHAKGEKLWSQHYYIEQEDRVKAWTDLYAAQSHAASVKLMNKVMAGIQSWIQQHG